MHELRLTDTAKGHEEDAARELVHELGSDLQSQTGLSTSAGPCERHEPPGVAEQRLQVTELSLAPDKWVRGNREVRRVQTLEWRKVGVAELVDPLRRGQIFEPMLSEVAQRFCTDQIWRRLRKENLPAVSRRGDARRPVDVDADVPFVGDERLAGMQAHAHADRAPFERGAAGGGGKQRIRGFREGDEERVALRVYLDATVGLERLAQRSSVAGEDLCIAVTELVDQPRGPFHVGEQEGNGSARQVAHSGIMRRVAARV